MSTFRSAWNIFSIFFPHETILFTSGSIPFLFFFYFSFIVSVFLVITGSCNVLCFHHYESRATMCESILKSLLKYPKVSVNILSGAWCSGYLYCTTSFNEAWIQVLRRFKPCLLRVGDLRWWGTLTMVPAESKAKRFSLVNHTTKTIHHHHYFYFFLWYNVFSETLLRRDSFETKKMMVIYFLQFFCFLSRSWV